MAIMSMLLEPLHCDALFLEEFCLLDGPFCGSMAAIVLVVVVKFKSERLCVFEETKPVPMSVRRKTHRN